MMKNPEIENAIRKLYDEIIGRKSKTVCITAATEKEGTTTIACAVAEMASSLKQKVLFCDFTDYTTSLSKKFNKQFKENTGDHLEQVYENIHFIEKFGFSLLPPPISLLPILMRKEVLADLLNVLKKQYDLIVIDSNNFNDYGGNTLSARSLCEVADCTTLIVLSGGVSEARVKETATNIARSGGKLIGCVMNDVNYPRLIDELCRETKLLNNKFPHTAKALRDWLRKSTFFNIEN
jgi:protein-tyrosine kinase